MTRARALALVSGGLDSVVALAAAREKYNVELLLFFDYGQRALEAERGAVTAVASYYGLPLREVSMRFLGELAPAGMRAGAPDEAPLDALDAVWVPNRNGVFLNVAAAFAERFDCGVVVCGFNREEAVEFPDNSGEYLRRATDAFALSTRNGVVVESATLDLDKPAIVRLGHALGAPLGVVWSCYRSGEKMCGRCASCRRLAAALEATPPDERPVIEFEDAA